LNIKSARRIASIASCLIAALPVTSHAATVLTDTFNDTVLDPAWQVSPSGDAPATGYWTAAEAGGLFTVTQIVDTVANSANWGVVRMSRSFDKSLTDFSADISFGWNAADGPPQQRAMQALVFSVRDLNGNVLAQTGMVDAWIDHPGGVYAGIGASLFGPSPYGVGTSGSMISRLTRTASQTVVHLNGSPILTVPGASIASAASVDVELSFYNGWHARSPGEPSFFGTIWVDQVSVTGTPIPEPGLLGGVLVGGVLLAGRRRCR